MVRRFIEHPNATLNTRAHNVFQKIILTSSPFRETIIPYYLKQTLKVRTEMKSKSLKIFYLPKIELPKEDTNRIHCKEHEFGRFQTSALFPVSGVDV